MIGGVLVEAGQQIVQVGGGEPPLEWLCRRVVAVYEGYEPVPDFGEVGEVVGREGLALDGRELKFSPPFASSGRGFPSTFRRQA